MFASQATRARAQSQDQPGMLMFALVLLSVFASMGAIAFMLHHVVILAVYFPGNFWALAVPFSSPAFEIATISPPLKSKFGNKNEL